MILTIYSLVQDYGIKGFPTIKVFVPGKPPIDYQGARDAKSIANFAYKQVCHMLLVDSSLHNYSIVKKFSSCESVT